MGRSGKDSARAGRGGCAKRGRIGDRAMGAFLDALRAGMTHEEAARAAGFSRSAFFRRRRRDGVFAARWADAISFSAGPRYVSSGKGRRLQLRRIRSVRFTDARKEIFLDRFAGTGNLAEAAEAAGVCQSTVFKHLTADPAFAARFEEALALCYRRLEADLLSRRIGAQQRLKEIEPNGALEPEFDRALKLLARWERRDGSLGPRRAEPGAKKSWTFEDAIAALEKKLRAIGVPIRDGDGDEEDERP